MGNLFSEIVSEVHKMEHELKKEEVFDKKYIPLLEEAYGVTKEQYFFTKQVSNEIIENYKLGNYINNGDYCLINLNYNNTPYGKIYFNVNWKKNNFENVDVSGNREYNKDGSTTVNLTIETNEKNVNAKLSGTLSHEIMHCFQTKLPKLKGVNIKNMVLYYHLLSFARLAPTDFTRMFFYGIYFTYHIEMTANISSISNYIETYFKEFKQREQHIISTNDLQKALLKNEKYVTYKNIMEVMKNIKPTKVDINYIHECLTKELLNIYDNQKVVLYDKNNFNVNEYVKKTKSIIIKKCGETLLKMRKNIMFYLENEK